MIKLIKKILTLTIIIYLLNIIIAFSLDKIYENSYANFNGSTLNYFIKTQNADTLIVGSSCALHHINPKYFGKKSFNLSHQGMHLGYHTSVIDVLYHSNKLPSRLLLFHIEPGDLQMKLKDKVEGNFHQLSYYYDKNKFIRDNINSSSEFEFLKYYFSSFRHNGNVTKLLSNFLTNNKKHPENQGFIPLPPSELDLARIKFTQKPESQKRTQQKINPMTIRYIEHVQKLCQKKNIKLIVFTSPYYKTPKELYENSKYLEKILAKKKIPYINYLNDEKLLIYEKKYWHDNYHMNSRGADIFSKKVHDDIQKIN